ncbi:MAG: hypothetical protein PHQ25_03910 [Acidobacteriota bacterium]|nr:hypothetical protein [Acidobacteriota bacterium]MDW3229064.1 hypothetical protein [Acidobacteriota bacterium]MDY0231568.1 hypothetical protein [Candidatus Saccharicenans sp.]
MSTLITILYYLMVGYFAACFIWNFRKSRNWQQEVLYLLVLLPFLLRLFRLK